MRNSSPHWKIHEMRNAAEGVQWGLDSDDGLGADMGVSLSCRAGNVPNEGSNVALPLLISKTPVVPPIR